MGSGLLKKHFVFDGRLSKITSDGFIDRGTADLEAYYLSGAFIGDQTSVRLNVFSGHEVTYQAWNGVPAQYVTADIGFQNSIAHPEAFLLRIQVFLFKIVTVPTVEVAHRPIRLGHHMEDAGWLYFVLRRDTHTFPYEFVCGMHPGNAYTA